MPLPDHSGCIHGTSNPAANACQVGQDALQIEASKRLPCGEANGPANILNF